MNSKNGIHAKITYRALFLILSVTVIISVFFITFKSVQYNKKNDQEKLVDKKLSNAQIISDFDNSLGAEDLINDESLDVSKSNYFSEIVPDIYISSELNSLWDLAQSRSLTSEQFSNALARIRTLAHSREPAAAAAAIITFLNSGKDAPTGLDFIVGEDGVLSEAPTMRVALIDFLGQTEPFQALEYSRSILTQPITPDEFAVALRNLAWLNPDRKYDAELRDHFSSMLDQQDWLSNPSAGFLEAFDIALHLGGEDMAKQLGGVLRMDAYDQNNRLIGEPESHPVNRAAFIALDRLMIREPQTIIGIFKKDPSWLEWAGEHRVSLLARLDPREPTQRAFLREILTKPDFFTPEELEYFSELYPNANGFSGNRLVTSREPVVAQEDLDKAALATVQAWQLDPQFAAVKAQLKMIESRLTSFLEKRNTASMNK